MQKLLFDDWSLQYAFFANIIIKHWTTGNDFTAIQKRKTNIKGLFVDIPYCKYVVCVQVLCGGLKILHQGLGSTWCSRAFHSLVLRWSFSIRRRHYTIPPTHHIYGQVSLWWRIRLSINQVDLCVFNAISAHSGIAELKLELHFKTH